MKSTTIAASLLALMIACGASFGAGYFLAKNEQDTAPKTIAAAPEDDFDDVSNGGSHDPLKLPEADNPNAESPDTSGVSAKRDGDSQIELPDAGPPDMEFAPDDSAGTPINDSAEADAELSKEARDKLAKLKKELGDIELPEFESVLNGEQIDFKATVSGMVVDSTGLPLAGAEIFAIYSETYSASMSGGLVRLVTSGNGDKGSKVATTNSAGEWTVTINRKVREKASLRAKFTATASGYAESESETVTLKHEDARSNVKLTVRGAGSVTGRVVDETGRGISGVTIGLRETSSRGALHGLSLGMGSDYSGVTDASGQFRIERVAEGRYAFRLTGIGVRQIAGPTTVDVQPGRETRTPADFKVAPTCSVKMTLQDAQGNPATGWVSLKFHDVDGKVVKSMNGPIHDGMFEKNDPPVGSFDVEVNVYGSVPQTIRATVLENQLCDLGTLILQPEIKDESGSVIPVDD